MRVSVCVEGGASCLSFRQTCSEAAFYVVGVGGPVSVLR